MEVDLCLTLRRVHFGNPTEKVDLVQDEAKCTGMIASHPLRTELKKYHDNMIKERVKSKGAIGVARLVAVMNIGGQELLNQKEVTSIKCLIAEMADRKDTDEVVLQVTMIATRCEMVRVEELSTVKDTVSGISRLTVNEGKTAVVDHIDRDTFNL